MADPLSIAGSVVGITAAGVQASVKLYALAEKIATASQRVTSIADDISSTCAILNQVRELIIPQPDAQGTLKSVFNSVALKDISHALRRCRSIFTEIEILLRRAFEQMGKRPAVHSKIELSRFEKAKWPFLQPQFDDLRNDLREAKGNLVLMIAVASLALAQRDGRQRPIHDRERLELGSTIVQLQRARTIKKSDRNILEDPKNQKRGLRNLFGKHKDRESIGYVVSERSRGVTRRDLSRSGSVKSNEVYPPTSRQDLDSMSLPSNRTCRISPTPSNSSIIAPSGASINNEAPEGQGAANASSACQTTVLALASVQSPRGPSVSPKRRELNSAQDNSAVEQKHLPDTVSSTPFVGLNAVAKPLPSPLTPTASNISYSPCHYQGYNTEYLQGLKTGYGNSVSTSRMEVPDRSLERLVKAYTDEGHDPHIVMLNLTAEQQNLIKKTCSAHPDAEVVYIHLQRGITVSSIFGTLNIETLRWIITSKVPWSGVTVDDENSLGQVPETALRAHMSPGTSIENTTCDASSDSSPSPRPTSPEHLLVRNSMLSARRSSSANVSLDQMCFSRTVDEDDNVSYSQSRSSTPEPTQAVLDNVLMARRHPRKISRQKWACFSDSGATKIWHCLLLKLLRLARRTLWIGVLTERRHLYPIVQRRTKRIL